MHFRTLGALAVVADGAALDLPSGRQPLLLACLLAHAGAVVRFDALAEALWPGHPRRTAADLRPVASRLRRCLDAEAEGRRRLATRATGYELRVGVDELDTSAFEADLGHARLAASDGCHEEARRWLTSALRRWRGPAYADFTDCLLLRPEAERLEELRRTAEEDLVDAELALGHEPDAVVALARLVAEEPLRERRRAQLMLALYRCDRQAAALRAYREYAGLLADELGLTPGPHLVRLEQQVLRQDPDLDADLDRRQQGSSA